MKTSQSREQTTETSAAMVAISNWIEEHSEQQDEKKPFHLAHREICE